MLHLGDITKINGAEAPAVDCIIGGSPCQDLSIAGKRAGLAGERSGLYMDQIRLIKEMRERDRANGRTGEFIRPRYMVWENVPGAFSSNKGKDFAAVLEEAVRVVEPQAPDMPVPEKGWPTTGVVMGDGWSIAWRVLDAQFWGVPQRRRRIALVADFGGRSAPEILFVRKGLHGNTEPSGTERQGFTAGAETGVSYAVRIRGGCDGGGKGALVQTECSGTLGCNNDQTIFYAIGSYHSNAWKSDNPHSGVYETDVAKTLDAVNCGYHGCNQGGTAVVASFKGGQGAKAGGIGYAVEQAPCLNAEGATPHIVVLNDQGGSIMSVSDDVSATLRAQEHGHQPCVLDMTHANDVIRECGETVPTLQSRMGMGGNQVPLLFGYPDSDRAGTLDASYFKGAGMRNGMERQIVYTAGQYGEYKQGCGTKQAAGGDHGGGSENLVAAVDCRNGTENPDVNGTLQAKESGGYSVNLQNTVRVNKRVRRLTPLECERLQGFPDHWTDIGAWVDSKGKKHECSDAARYKALGNSIALPPWKWVLKRLCAQYERDATMASLFDGIGGFPLLWEQLNGEGSCVWASEIEEFPMAVTKLRFSPTGQKE